MPVDLTKSFNKHPLTVPSLERITQMKGSHQSSSKSILFQVLNLRNKF